jgi:hypothetical protein
MSTVNSLILSLPLAPPGLGPMYRARGRTAAARLEAVAGYTSRAQRNPVLPVELSSVFELRPPTR